MRLDRDTLPDMDDIARLMPLLTEDERRQLDQLLAGALPIWVPLPGPQSDAYHAQADVVGYGGAAGGGKSDLALGLALTRHLRSAIFRREATQMTGLVDRLAEILAGRDGYNGSEKIWRLGQGRQIEFGSCPNLGDEQRYQGRPKDLLVIDEATHFLPAQVRYLMGWVRTTKKGQRCRVIMTFNPPTDAEGRWVIEFFAPWLDPSHPNPAMPGEIRWFATIDGKEGEVAGPEPIVRDAETILPQSRTFIPSRIADNPFLTGTGYERTLQALPEPLRSQMLYGDFQAGVGDDPWQVIPTAWVQAAQDRWEPRAAPGPMDSLGVDVARGGDDNTVFAPRHGTWFADLITHPGTATPNGPVVAGLLLPHLRDKAPVHVDVIGWGASVYDFLIENGVHAVPVNASETAPGRAKESNLAFVNLRAELWWRMREALDPRNSDPIYLPPRARLRADLCAPRWKMTRGGILIEAKEDLRKRIGRSPDEGDAVVMANMVTAKRDASLNARLRQSHTAAAGVNRTRVM